MIYSTVCDELLPLTLEQRRDLAASPRDPALHAPLAARLPVLYSIELKPPSASPGGNKIPRIAFWNAERGKYISSSAQWLRELGIDLILLCEMDQGMARSGQLHTTLELADALNMGYVFAVEYIELGLGDERERRWHACKENQDGLHGAAILSPYPLERPVLFRLEMSGDWFDGSRGERRIGGRIALTATVRIAGSRLVAVSVHLESHSDPQDRARQMRTLLDAIDDYASGLPVIIGGDFNTKSTGRAQAKDARIMADLLAQDPQRLINPVPYEPLFTQAKSRGYDWQACNTQEPTQRTRPDGTPAPPLGRLDWFFTRGLSTSQAATIAAVDRSGQILSDHDLLLVSITEK